MPLFRQASLLPLRVAGVDVVGVEHVWVGLSDEVRLGVLTRWVPPGLVDEVLAECGCRALAPRALPDRFMVYFTLALALFQSDSYEDVAENLVAGQPGLCGRIPNKASFTRARERLGEAPLAHLFSRVAGAVAGDTVCGALWRGFRLAAVDGFVVDVPDTAANREFFGGPTGTGNAAIGWPQARVVMLTECGTHAVIDAAIGCFNGGEPELAVQLAASAAGMLVLADRGLAGVQLWQALTGVGAHVVMRAKSNIARRVVKVLPDGTYLARFGQGKRSGGKPGSQVIVRVIEYVVDGGTETIRLLTDLHDPHTAPAAELAQIYHRRWEAETAIRQIKTFQRGRQQILRSGTPSTARQEIWAHLVVHHALTSLIIQIAATGGADPDRISFVKILKHTRRSIIRQSLDVALDTNRLLQHLIAVATTRLHNGTRRLRAADRLLKRPITKYAIAKDRTARKPTRRTTPAIITLRPVLLQ